MKWIKAKEKMPPEPGMYFVKSNAHGKIILNIEDLDSAKQYLGTGDCEWLSEDEQDEGWVPVGEGLKLVATERKRQIEVEGWNNTHDADHDKMQLTGAAACYAANAINKKCGGRISRFQYNFPPEMNFLVNNGDRGDRKLDKGGWRDGWPWEAQWDKRDKHDVLRSLVISAALIVAEIDNIVNPPATT